MCGLTEEQTYQVAYLTMRGWEFHRFGSYWTKPGQTRSVERTHPCGCCHFEAEQDQFDLDQAYDRQWGLDP